MAVAEDGSPIPSGLQDRYEILSEFGVGSFGRVYKARQLSTGSEVAIKTLRIEESDTSAETQRHTERFRREMRLCAALSHPNIVRLIDSGEFGDGRLYAVFEFVPGKTLREVLAGQGALDRAEALHLMTQVLDALSCAHAQGIVHRDLKPENIMVTRTGARRNALVLDFGLGGFSTGGPTGDPSRLTATREMMGTPCYAAPEQLRGESPSPLSDLYSWGLIFLECLTGEIALSGNTAHEVLLKQLGPEPVPIPASLRDRRLRRVLEAVTAKDINKRNVTVDGLLESLAVIGRELSVVSPAAQGGSSPREGERRHLTMVSCRATVQRVDGAAVDLEDLDHVLGSQLPLYERIAGQGGGLVGATMGERVLLVFGYPRAQENDARRAVRAALRIVAESQSASARLEADGALRVGVHIGVHSGLAIVRKQAEGTGYEIVGDSPRLAGRLDEHASPGEVLVSLDTWRLLGDEVHCEPAGEIEFPGSGGRVRVLRATGERTPPGTDTVLPSSETPFVDRAHEIGQLLGAWSQARNGMAQTILLSGEPGIGKSRLVRELRQRAAADAWLECRCVVENQNSPLRPIVDLLTAISEPIEQLLVRHGFDPMRTMPLFASLLSVPLAERFPPLRLSPERQKELTLTAIVSLLLRMARTQPLMFVVEDVHWLDPTTGELLGLLVEETRASGVADLPETPRLGVLLTARPEYCAPWSPMTVISLDRLDRDAVGELVSAALVQEAPVPAEVVDEILARTDGVPLFVEEVTRVLADSGMLQTEGRSASRRDVEIPDTLRELLAARLDLLSTGARETIQLAAALGREFRYELLRAVAPKGEWILREDLRELMDARLVYARRSTASEAYVFKHSLVRDAAYESMMRATRRGVHARIAAVLREQFPEVSQQQPELLAQHLEAGGETAAAIEYWHRAGDRALRRAAYAEATQHLQRGLAALERLPESAARKRMEVELLTTLGTVQFSTKGYAAPEVEETFARAHVLCEQLGQEVDPRVLSGVIGVYINRGEREATDGLLPQFERLAERADEAVAAVTGLTTLGLDAFWRGAHARARGYLDRARRAYLTDEFQRYARDYGYDGGIFCYGYIVWNLWALGYPAQAEAAYHEFLALAEKSFDPFSVPLALAFGVALAHSRRDGEETLARAERLIEVSTEQKLYFWLPIGYFGRGGALTLGGRAEEGIPDIRQGLEVSRMIGSMTVYSYYLTFLAAAHCAAGQFVEGLAVVDEGLDLCARALARYHEPELHRLKGELLHRRGDLDAADACLRNAVDLARRRDAKSWELRAATSLARLLHERGKRAEARSAIESVYGWFTEGFELADLRDARDLLATCT